MKRILRLLRDNTFAIAGAIFIAIALFALPIPIWIDLLILIGIFLLWSDTLIRNIKEMKERIDSTVEGAEYAHVLRNRIKNAEDVNERQDSDIQRQGEEIDKLKENR